MSITERRIYKQMARRSGDDVVEVAAKSDGTARGLVADGGNDPGFRNGIARTADSDAIDSFDESTMPSGKSMTWMGRPIAMPES